MLVYVHHTMKEFHKVIVVAGPTASGKSDFAVELAHKVDGEIISADSRQVYKGLDIGTGKITQEEMKGIPHHMLDVVEPGKDFSVSEYARLAKPILHNILERGKTPIICGGTGQYIDALIYDQALPKVPPNKALRQELEARPIGELYMELMEKDPHRAETIDRFNKVRLVRALEIVYSLGSVPELPKPKLLYETEIYIMNPTREALRKRIEKRLLKRLDQGMLDECKKLLLEGVSHAWLEKIGLEYRYISRYLKGELSYAEFVEKLAAKINQYAKRQQTWNKKYLPISTLIDVV
jgi:tRNA dimethylallyltransferase